MKTLSKFLALFIFGVVILAGCGGGGEKNSSAPTYSINFYDTNLDLIKTVNIEVKPYNLSDLQSGYTWYTAESSLPITNYNITQNISFYAIPSVHEVRNETQLYNIRDDLNGNYILMNDIALTEATLNETSGWDPIGDENNPFAGIFNGNRHKVTDFFMNNTIKIFVGFFGYIDGGTVKNFGLEISEKGIVEASLDMGRNSDVGSIAGTIYNGIIFNCYSKGNIISSRGTVHIGGIAGSVDNTFMNSCYTVGDITITGDWAAVGGIAAYAGNSNISNCYSNGNIKITEGNFMSAGGVIGYIYSTSVNNCYSTGNISVSGWITAGGIVEHDQNGISTINNCAAINENISSSSGSRIGKSSAVNNFANSAMLVNGAVVGDSEYDGIGKTLAELQTRSTYEDAVNGNGLGGLGWKFGTNDENPWVWGAFVDYPYPTFYWQTQRP
ncbi:MAG: hypothetical protein LBS39_00150 [Campylobacteraceae bacterium]|jgi:hypothetical protein|nr:hypothetical protein [Campylobacteraceae bacterium]